MCSVIHVSAQYNEQEAAAGETHTVKHNCADILLKQPRAATDWLREHFLNELPLLDSIWYHLDNFLFHHLRADTFFDKLSNCTHIHPQSSNKWFNCNPTQKRLEEV
jgi:hypothetical protein